jgi:O-antigen/teichoic acid export membrane protein
VYGVSTILGRLLNFALIPIFSHLLDQTRDMGHVNALYGYVALLNVLCAMGMETTYFFYANKSSEPKAFNNAFTIILGSSSIISLLLLLTATGIDGLLSIGNPWYIRLIAGMLFFDALAILPFARLRHLGKAKRFAGLKLLNILANVGFNILFFVAYTYMDPQAVIFDPGQKVFYIFLSNLLASALTLALVAKEYKGVRPEQDGKAMNDMLSYAWPLIIVGLAAWVNENMDKSLMEKLLPGSPDEGYAQTGIYGAVYKLSIAMAIVVQAFKFAAEPFFFGIQKDSDAKATYALVLKWFVIVECLVFLGVALNLDLVLHILDEKYRVGKHVVPIVLLGQLFLGIHYNLSVWYKLTEQTIWGLYISVIGAAITTLSLFTLVPSIGYIGAAWATFFSFLAMMVVSALVGRRHYPIPYDFGRLALYIGIAIVFWLLFAGVGMTNLVQQTVVANSLILLFGAFVWAVEKPRRLLLLRR